jgi:hypothetical protein
MLSKNQTPIEAWAKTSSQFGCNIYPLFQTFSLVELIVVLRVQFSVHSIFSLVLQVFDGKDT